METKSEVCLFTGISVTHKRDFTGLTCMNDQIEDISAAAATHDGSFSFFDVYSCPWNWVLLEEGTTDWWAPDADCFYSAASISGCWIDVSPITDTPMNFLLSQTPVCLRCYFYEALCFYVWGCNQLAQTATSVKSHNTSLPLNVPAISVLHPARVTTEPCLDVCRCKVVAVAPKCIFLSGSGGGRRQIVPLLDLFLLSWWKCNSQSLGKAFN